MTDIPHKVAVQARESHRLASSDEKKRAATYPDSLVLTAVVFGEMSQGALALREIAAIQNPCACQKSAFLSTGRSSNASFNTCETMGFQT
jgi:hypothetical protein